MGILSWILLGLIVGVLAKWIMPGPDPGGILVTIGIGIAGAFVGGLVASLLGLGTPGGFSLGGIVTATAGALAEVIGDLQAVLVLCGKQPVDPAHGQVRLLIAQKLGSPC